MSARGDGISIVIIGYNSQGFILRLLPTISACRTTEVILVDNASDDDTVQTVSERFSWVKVIANPVNKGYAFAVNIGVSNASHPNLLVINADVEFHPGSIDVMADYLANHPSVGLLGPQQVFPGGGWQRSYGQVPGIKEGLQFLAGITSMRHLLRKVAWPHCRVDRRTREVSYVDGAVLLFRKTAWQEVGGFDENFFFYTEEADFCYRLHKAGWKIVFLPSAQVVHVRGGSSTKREPESDKFIRMQVDGKLYFVKKHFPGWQVRAYVALQKMHAAKTCLLHACYRRLVFSKTSRGFEIRDEKFRKMKRIWHECLVDRGRREDNGC